MSVEWAIGILIAAQSGLLSLFIHHILACNKRDRERAAENLQIYKALTSMSEALKRVEAEIGTHETGLRGQLHRLRNEISPYIIRARLAQERRGGNDE